VTAGLEKRIYGLRPLFVELRESRDGVSFEPGDVWAKEPPWEEVQRNGDQRVADLEAVARKLETKPPRSLVEVIRTFGYLDLYKGFLSRTYTQLLLGWADAHAKFRKTTVLELDPVNLIHGAGGKKLHGMAFVNDPGGAPGHFYSYLEELPGDKGEYVWCYIGFDSAHPNGIRLAPIATDFVSLIQAVALGLTDVLLLPKRQAASQRRSLQKVASERAAPYKTALKDIERALKLTARAEVHLAKKAQYDPGESWTLERGREAIRERLDTLSF
jgi:hypothetical protein